jgi:hypothetical protein
MIPAGYMAMSVYKKDNWLKARKKRGFVEAPPQVMDEAHELEFDRERWGSWSPEPSFPTNVALPVSKQLEGFDLVSFNVKTSPECSPLSCNAVAIRAPIAYSTLLMRPTDFNDGVFKGAIPGPYRIFSVYSVDWL